jgi:PTS system ascorbate-specific IIB component
MKKIMAVCGSGLGSSFMVEMNVTDILKELGVTDKYEAFHTSLADVTAGDADIFITALDLADSASHLPNLIVLNSVVDKDELRDKIKEKINL